MTLFLLSIGCVVLELSDAVDSIHRLSLSILWRFQVWQGLCFRWRFMHQQWHSIFDNSMRQPWLYFCYRLDASFLNWVTLSILYIGCHSVFIDDFKFDRDFVFADDLCISNDKAFLTIPCVSHDFIFSIDFMRRSWINWRCQFHTATITQYSMMISSKTGTLFSLTIYGSTMT
jgi:hypothetical protein